MSSYNIVIDPGHGGNDVGSIGKSPNIIKGNSRDIYEKDLVLKLAKRVNRYLSDRKFTKWIKKPVKVRLTRDSDATVSLYDRAALVRNQRTDLFLSLHLNSEASGTARGFETYFLNNTTTEVNQHLEKLNRHHSEEREGVSPDLALLLRSVASDSMVDESRKAAETIQKSLSAQVKHDRLPGLESRGVRQGLLQVLLDAQVPAVLVESAFISNAQDLRLASSAKSQDSLARGIALGVVKYLRSKHP